MKLADSVSRIVESYRTLTDAVKLADSVSRAVASYRELADALELADSVTVAVGWTHILEMFDALASADSATNAVNWGRILNDALTIGNDHTLSAIIVQFARLVLQLGSLTAKSVKLTK